jgi:hypothetical protein
MNFDHLRILGTFFYDIDLDASGEIKAHIDNIEVHNLSIDTRD